MQGAHVCQIYIKENLYHSLAPLISMMTPLVTWPLSVTRASKAEIRDRLNLRWTRTTSCHSFESPLDSVCAGTDYWSIGCDFHFSPKQNWSSLKTSTAGVLPTSQWFPLAINPVRHSNRLIPFQGMEEFPTLFTLPETQEQPRRPKLLCLHASWLTHKCPRLCQGTLRAGGLSTEPHLGREIWLRAEGLWQKKKKVSLGTSLPSTHSYQRVKWCGFSAAVFPFSPDFFLPVLTHTYACTVGITAHYRHEGLRLSSFLRKQ